jgi:hypothetical protein
MKAIFEAYDGLKFEVEGEKLTSILKEVGGLIDAIGWESCGKCNAGNTFPNHREVGADAFYELKCRECGAVLQLGVHKEGGGLYKKRMAVDSKGKAMKEGDKAVYLPNRGWLKWNPTTQKME